MLKTTYQPTQNYLLIRPITPDAISKGGILIPDMARRPISEGYVEKHGPLCTTNIAVGMEVVFNQHSEFRIQDTDTGEAFFVIEETNIILCKAAKPEAPARPIDWKDADPADPADAVKAS